MNDDDLARWTPVRLDFSGPAPAVYWADLSGERFAEPFFQQTVTRWACGPTARPLVRTGLEALADLDAEPSMEPAGMIFHLSRCGSTLVSRLLGTLPGVVILAEPGPLNAVVGLDGVDEATVVRLVRLVVRALGRVRLGDERQLVLKCTSWNIRRREILSAAFPSVPWVWVQRDPAHVLASLLADPPGWLDAPARAESAARALGSMLEAARGGDGADAAGRLCVDYDDLPDAVWQRIAPHFGLDIDPAAIARMTDESRFYSKDPSGRLFVVKPGHPVTDEMRSAAARFAVPGYRALRP